ncbi:hypothetical protein GCM10007291_42700 [Gemmobacter nanjingensis]|uniref:DUF4238 domain-containing protein n=1 Tax=Gemmobacter nanjingensis TaxID=488454 RepID=A0ABQ3FT70_9RHOB|nr:hypothetical protein [Gemmobacter nanjingensis]GHC36673.1 hypothetical protein GCM10007291_42700 [Gemmobacter nanjingensis]
MRYLPPDLEAVPTKTSEWTSSHAKTWLWHGFSRYHLRSDDIPAFFPLGDYFSVLESPETEIGRLCSKSVRFRSKVVPAIAGLLGDVPPSETGFRVFHHLQNLTIELHEPSLIEAMWNRLASPGFLDRAHSEQKQELFARAFLCAEKLSSSDEVQELLKTRMLASRHFNPDWTPSILAAMLQKDPASVVASLRLLSAFVDSVADEARVSSIIDGCTKVIAELVQSYADPSKIVEAMNAEEIFEMATLPGDKRITGGIALVFAEKLKIDFEQKDQSSTADSPNHEIVAIDASDLLNDVKGKLWHVATTATQALIKAVVPRDYRSAKMLNKRREFQRRNQPGDQVRWQDERMPIDV